MTKKELRSPDALQRAGLEAKHWMEGKEKYVLGAVGLVVVVGLGIALADYLSDRNERNARHELGLALTPVMRPVTEPGSTPPPADPNATEAEKPFATQKEKDEAIVASLSKFIQEHKGTRSAVTACLTLGQSYARLGQYDQALEQFAAFLKDAPKEDPLRAVALEAQGYAYEAKGDLDKASAAFGELAGLSGKDFLDGMGQFHQARILILQGKKDEAAKKLSEIPAAFPNSAAARMATERMNLLASQGVNVPAPRPPEAKDAGAAEGQQG